MRTNLSRAGSGFIDNGYPLENRFLASEFHNIYYENSTAYETETGNGFGFGRGFGHIEGCSSVEYENQFPFELIQYFKNK